MRTRYISGDNAAVDPADRGLAYGDGLFETMAMRRGRALRLDLHLDRLAEGCERLAIDPPDRAELIDRISDAAARASDGHGTLKLILTRGTGPRGYAPPPDAETTVLIQIAPAGPEPASEISVVTLETRLGENVKLAGIKHLCRLEQVLGRLELNTSGADEGLMLSTSGHVIGGTSRNLFAAIDGRLVTPDVTRAGVAGVMRRVVLKLAAQLGIATEVRPVLPAEIGRADELFMTNALVGIQSVSRVDDHNLASRFIATRLRESFASNDGDPGA